MYMFFKRIFFALLLLYSFQDLHASHIVGGEISYRCLGDNQYEIILTVYRDCFFGNPLAYFDDPASVGFFDSENQLITDIGFFGQILIPLMNDDTLSQTLEDPCFSQVTEVCVHTTTYREVIELPFRPGGYQIAYQRCCRNQTIQNIVEPDLTGATFYGFISEEALLSCNTSATFNEWPPIYICAGEPINFDHSASDAEGDSLSYRLCTPLEGALPRAPRPQPPFPPEYDDVIWAPTFSVDNMLGGDDPLVIDEATGRLTGTPPFLGQFVVGICVDEFRDGELISTTRRDFQYNVGECLSTSSAFFSPENVCDSVVVFTNESENADSIIWIIGDIEAPDTFSVDNEFIYTFPAPGEYSVSLIANPGTICADTLSRLITIFDLSIDIDFEVSVNSCSDSLEFVLINLTEDEIGDSLRFNWRILSGSDTLSFMAFDSTVTVGISNEVMVTLFAENELGCEDSLTITLEVPFVEINPEQLTYTICVGDSLQLISGLLTEGADFQWSSEPEIDIPNVLNPIISPVENTAITFSADADSLCPTSVDFSIIVFETIEGLEVEAFPDTIFRFEESTLTVTFDGSFTYEWSPSNTLSDPAVFNPVASPLETTTYEVIVTNAFGCSDTTTVTVVVFQQVCDTEFVFIPNLFSPNGDGVNDMLFVESAIIEEMFFTVYNRWGNKVFETNDQSVGWDGTFNGEEAPQDAYGYYFEGRCIGGERIQLKGSVTLVR